jgi:hypothetical protein
VNGFPDGVVWPQNLLVETMVCLLSIPAGGTMLLIALRSAGKAGINCTAGSSHLPHEG